MGADQKKPKRSKSGEGRRLRGPEQVRKLAEDYEYKPAQNLKPLAPGEAPTDKTPTQDPPLKETPQE